MAERVTRYEQRKNISILQVCVCVCVCVCVFVDVSKAARASITWLLEMLLGSETTRLNYVRVNSIN